jgi:putative membrane protein
LLTDHTASLNELKTLAQAKAISVPVEEHDASKRKLEDLAEEEEEDFDEAWCKEMIDMHDKSIDKYRKRLDDTEDDELKDYLSKTLPVLEKHHADLKACEEKLQAKR